MEEAAEVGEAGRRAIRVVKSRVLKLHCKHLQTKA